MSHMKKCFRAKSAFYTLCWHMTNCFSWKSTHRFQKRHWVTLQLCQSYGLHWIICVFFPERWTETTALIHVVFIWFNFFKISLDLSLFLVLFRNFLRKVVIFFTTVSSTQKYQSCVWLRLSTMSVQTYPYFEAMTQRKAYFWSIHFRKDENDEHPPTFKAHR